MSPRMAPARANAQILCTETARLADSFQDDQAAPAGRSLRIRTQFFHHRDDDMTQMQSPGYGMPTGMKPHRGVMILVFGILSWCVCLIFGIVAWVMGNSDLREMREGRMDPSGESMTQAG